MMQRQMLLSALMLVPLGACNLAPDYHRPSGAIPAEWPRGASDPARDAAPVAAGASGWPGLITDPRLRKLILRALDDNRNLRATIANVATVRAQYRIQHANEFPAITASTNASVTRSLTGSQASKTNYSTNLGLSQFEIDLFGRLHDLSQQAFEQYLATQSGLSAARISLVGAVATDFVAIAADRDNLAIATEQLRSGQRSLDLTQSLERAGLVGLDSVANAQTLVAQAKAAIAQNETVLAQDRNALELLVGGTINQSLLPASLAEIDPRIATPEAGLSSSVLLDRPDVVEAEHQLKGANVAIGAARAAFFPTITLTSALGLASTALSDLFTGGALNWSASPSVSQPVLGGTAPGNLAFARARKDYFLALYQSAVQSAFRDVADALARRSTILRERKAQSDLVASSDTAYRLADAQFRAGTDSFLTLLVAQRSLFAARQAETATITSDLQSRISLYQALGADGSISSSSSSPASGASESASR